MSINNVASRVAAGAAVLAILGVVWTASAGVAHADTQPAVTVTAPGVTVTIAAAGYALNELTIPVGQTVSLLNLDDRMHTVRLDDAQDTSCADMGDLAIWPGVYRSCTFTAAGTYVMDDPNSSNARRSVTIRVTQPTDALTAVDLAVSRSKVASGGGVLITGTASVARAGLQVDIIAKQISDGTYKKVGQTTTTSSGSFSFTAYPRDTTVYFANVIDSTTIVPSLMKTVEVAGKTRSSQH